MDVLVACPRCGECDDLVGRSVDDQIEVECQACGLTWLRNLQPQCAKCNSRDVRPAYEAVVAKSRGTQLSMQSAKLIYLCEHCDTVKLSQYLITNSPLMPDRLPTD